MENRRKNHSIVFRGLILVLALALTIVYLPLADVVSLAFASTPVDYNHITIGTVSDDIQTVVNRGATYVVPNAYIGGDIGFRIGTVADDTVLDDTTDPSKPVTLKTSTVTVKYSSNVLGVVSEGASSSAAVTVSGGDTTFVANKLGAYTITYAYTYEVGGKTYKNSYDLVVTSELADAEISFVENSADFTPSIYDLAQAVSGDSYKALNVNIPEVYSGDEEQEVEVTLSKATAQADTTKDYLLVEVSAPNGNAVTVTNTDSKYYIGGDNFKVANFGAGTYTIKYSYYAKGEFIASTTKSVKVYAEASKHYTDYKLELELGSTWSDSAQTGVVAKLPTAKGLTASTTTPAKEDVDVYYTVAVYYKTAGGTYSLINVSEYNTAAGETVLNEDGTLVDPSEFKPLKDGSYSFVYTIYDRYYDKDSSNAAAHTASTTVGLYEFTDVKDSTAPTPVVYDAAEYVAADGYVDASYKLASRANPSGIVVYAIGMDDNVSKVGDTGVELQRNIMTSDTVTVLSITKYNDKNLVFNYEGLEALKANNYLIRKQTETVTTEDAMVAWLKGHNYLVVVDNGNATRLYNLLKDAGYTFDASVTDAATALTWFKSEAALTAGFAYLDTNSTFGASTANNGTGNGQYYIHYYAKDAAGNTNEVSKSMYVTTFSDDEAPEIKFSSTLADSYLPDAKITFNVPTASDNRDNNMKVNVLYRYLDSSNDVVAVAGTTANDLTDVFADLSATLQTKYAKYAGNGYIDLTDAKASSYTIDLSEVDSTAVKLQIAVYAYDDMGNVGVYVKESEITNVTDNYPPRFDGALENAVEFHTNPFDTLEQGAEVVLPTVRVVDDAAAYLTYDVNVTYVDADGNETKLSVYDFSSSREMVTGNAGILTVNAGKFTAAYKGEYNASIAFTDSANKTIVGFAHFTTTAREIVQPPVISTDLESKTVELDDHPVIEIAKPTINYELDDSVAYEDLTVSSTETYVVRTNWSTNYGTANSFAPTAVGTYELKYDVKIDVYEREKFTYKNTFEYDTATDTYTVGGYYERTGFGTNAIKVVDGSFKTLDYVISKDEDGVITLDDGNKIYTFNDVNDFEYEDGTPVSAGTGVALDFEDQDLEAWFEEFRQYNLSSDTYTITVNDTQGPKISEATYDYPTIMSVADFTTNGIKILPIEATDASGINVEKSKIVLSWKRANGTTSGSTGSKTYEGTVAFGDIEAYKATATETVKLDGAYTITYTVYDNNGNYTTKAYTIYVGDNEDPVLSFADDFVETSYTVGTKLTIDTAKITATDNNPLADDAKPTIKLVNTATNEEVSYEEEKYTKDGKEYSKLIFAEFSEVGTYTLTVEIEDQVGHVAQESFSIDVSSKTKNVTPVYQIVGIILIVLSVLILVGVVVYFIVAKVKLDKELKKK